MSEGGKGGGGEHICLVVCSLVPRPLLPPVFVQCANVEGGSSCMAWETLSHAVVWHNNKYIDAQEAELDKES